MLWDLTLVVFLLAPATALVSLFSGAGVTVARFMLSAGNAAGPDTLT